MKDRLRTKAIFQISKVLWHLDIFRRSFRELNGHTCMLDSCIFCALKELFSQLQFSHESALPPDALRRALAESFFDQQRFQLGFMDDAAECFENILLRIHFHLACGEAEDLCSARHCIPHVKFAMTLVEQSVCGACGATSEPLPFTQMVHYVSASALISQAKQAPMPNHPDLFGQLLKKAGGMGDIRDCPSACGAKIQIRRTLTNHPEIVSVGIVWDSERPSLEHVMALLSTLRTSLRLSEVFHTPNPNQISNSLHQLVGVVTYYGKHYSTFFFHTKLKVWIYFDDANVREVGPMWEQVVDKCRRGRYQPLLLLFAAPDGTAVDSSTAPKAITVAPTAKPPLGRRSLTPSPEKPAVGSLAQRRAVTPNPDQANDLPNNQRPLQVLSEYQNLTGLQKAAMWTRKELVRRDSGNWSGDRNSASSSSSTSLENPYQYILGKVQSRNHLVPRSPTSLKGGESSSGGSQCDPGYDSYSLSSTDSLPLQQQLKHNLQLAQIPEGHQSPVLANIQFPQKKGLSECERLCDEADILLQHSQATDDLEMALSYANAAVGKARQAMDLPYSNPQAATAARIKHSTCIMHARSIHKKIEEPNGPRHGEGRHSREGSGCSNRGSHSRQGSKDKGNHSRQNSKELLPDLKPPEPVETIASEKNIEIYATLPKTRKGLLSRATSKIKNTVEDEEYLMYDRPGRSLSRNKPPNGKKDEKRARSEERNSKNQKEKEFVSNQISKEAKKQMKQEQKEEQKQGKKQHKVRRKLLMGGLIRRKNRSMPDLREDEVTVKAGSKDDTNVGKLDKQPSLSGYLSEGHLEYTGNPNLERSKLMRKSLHGSKLIQMAKVPPPPPLRTTSQLSKERQFQIGENVKENTLSLWREPEPQSLPPYTSYHNPEAVTYANGGYLLNNCQNKLVTTAQVHQVSSPDKELREKGHTSDEDVFDLPPYPSPLNSVTHSRQASEDFPPPPNEIENLSTSSLLEQLQRKRQQILNENMAREMAEADQIKPCKTESWLSELQAKQASLRNRDLIETDISFPQPTSHSRDSSNEIKMQPDAISPNIGKRLDDQISTVKDLKSKFETISLKASEILPEKPKINTLTSRDSPITTNPESKQEPESPMKPAEGEIKSSLARGDDLKRKQSKKKNVTFCEQVVLVATAEEDKSNSYIPNPILERVLRSVLHRDSPHQETKEIAVHSVVPLKRNDSGSYGQCADRNQPENKVVSVDEVDCVGLPLPEQCDKTVGLPSPDVPCSRSYSLQRMLPSPVPNRQGTRMQGQMNGVNHNPYQPVVGLVSPTMQAPTSMPQTSLGSSEQVSNSHSPYYTLGSVQAVHSEDQSQMSRYNSSQPVNRDPRMLSELEHSKFNSSTSTLLRSDSFARDPEQRMIHENANFNQSGLPSDGNHLYNSSGSLNSNSSSTSLQNMQSNGQQIASHTSLPSSQGFSNPQYPTSAQTYVQSHMNYQQKSQSLNHHIPSNPSQIYHHLPPSVVQAHQQQVSQQQQQQQQQQLTNSNGHIMNVGHMRPQQLPNTSGHQVYQHPPMMQQRNLPSPSPHQMLSPNGHSQALQSQSVQNLHGQPQAMHNQPQTMHNQTQVMQSQVQGAPHQSQSLHSQSQPQGVHSQSHPSTQSNPMQIASAQQYQRNISNPHLHTASSYQIRTAAMQQSQMVEPLSHPLTPSQQHGVIHNQQFHSQSPYPTHAQPANASIPGVQQSPGMNMNHSMLSQVSNGSPMLNHHQQVNQQGHHSTSVPSPSPSIKSQMMLNHSQLSIHQMNGQQNGQPVQQSASYMTLPQKMRQPVTNTGNIQQVMKGRPQGVYHPETPMQEFPQQNMVKREVPNLRADVYQRVPNLLPSDAHSNPQYPPNGPTYQGQTPVQNVQHVQTMANGVQQVASPLNSNNQALTVKYSPYQHPPMPRQIPPEQQKSQSAVTNSRTNMCNLCRKKQIVLPSIYCADCDFYMSRFKPRT